MGHVFRPEGSEWYFIDYVDAAGKRHREKAATNAAAAKEILKELEGRVAQAKRLGEQGLKEISFADYCDVFIGHVKEDLRPRVVVRYRTSLKPLRAFFEKRKLTAIDAESIEKFKQMRATHVTHASTNRDLQVLRRMLNLAVIWGYLRDTPMRFIKLFRETKGRVRYLSSDEYAALARHCSPELKRIVDVALLTGMRQGEMLALMWADLDLENGFISINNPKNGVARKVAISDDVNAELRALKAQGRSVYAFTDKSGAPLSPRTLQWQFRRALDSSGVENFRFHDLRHTAASWMAMADVPMQKIKMILGHLDIRMTDRYSHLSPESTTDAVRKHDPWLWYSRKERYDRLRADPLVAALLAPLEKW
jgi:integrase